MTSISADLSLAVDGLVASVITLGIGVVVCGVVVVMAWAIVRGALRP